MSSALSVRELLRLFDVRKGYLGMYKLLADESGLKKRCEKYCVVSGFVGSADQWDTFNEKWPIMLHKAGVSVFHALEFWKRADKDGVICRPEPYTKWKESDDVAFIRSLLDVVTQANLRPVSMAVDIDLFLSLSHDERRWLTTSSLYDKNWDQRGKPDDPWFFAFREPILSATHFVPEGDKLYPVFADRDSPDRKKKPVQTKARELYREILAVSVVGREKLADTFTFSTPEEIVGLQAADLLANRVRIYVGTGLGQGEVATLIRAFLESDRIYMRVANAIDLDRRLRSCPFRSSFWNIDNFRSAEPDYLEKLRGSGVKVLAAKHPRLGRYYSHHLLEEKVRSIFKFDREGD
ncbi:MAG TPA: hypothetical protein VII95_20010 [Terriglobales bacterium]|jgi:hypothetical protein